jgi:hypothetical protein
VGMIFIALYLFTNRFDSFPDFLKGAFGGLGIGLSLIGMYAYNHDISGLRKKKINLLKKILPLK